MADNKDVYRQAMDSVQATSRFKSETKAMLTIASREEDNSIYSPEPEAAAPEKAKKPKKKKKAIRLVAPALVAVAAVLVVAVGLRAVFFPAAAPETAPMEEAAAADTEDAAPEAAMVDEAEDDADEVALPRTPSNYFASTTKAAGAASESDAGAADEPDAAEGEAAEDTGAGTDMPSFKMVGLERRGVAYQTLILPDFEEYSGELLGESHIPETLPVYRNEYYEVEDNIRGREDELETLATEQADALGLEIEGSNTIYETGEEQVVLTADGALIRAYPDETVSIRFSEVFAAGGELAPVHEDAAAMKQYAEKLVENWYPELFNGMEMPTAEVLPERNERGDINWYVRVYDGMSAFENRELHAARILFDESGSLVGFDMWRYNSGEKLGDYPTVSLERATSTLQNGLFLSTISGGAPSTSNIAGVDLVYLVTGTEDSYLPFYLFYVELPDEETIVGDDLTLKSYGLYYVPAITTDWYSW